MCLKSAIKRVAKNAPQRIWQFDLDHFELRAEEEAATEAKRQKIDIADDEVKYVFLNIFLFKKKTFERQAN